MKYKSISLDRFTENWHFSKYNISFYIMMICLMSVLLTFISTSILELMFFSEVRHQVVTMGIFTSLMVSLPMAYLMTRIVFHVESKQVKLYELATVDGLTGLKTRQEILENAKKTILFSQRFNRPFSIIMIDLDYFKAINDRYGHLVGDEVLAGTGRSILESIRTVDIPGRYGGEEFLVLLPETSAELAVSVAQRIADNIARPNLVKNYPSLIVTASIGVTSLCENDIDFESLILRADKALYRAKDEGRDRIICA